MHVGRDQSATETALLGPAPCAMGPRLPGPSRLFVNTHLASQPDDHAAGSLGRSGTAAATRNAPFPARAASARRHISRRKRRGNTQTPPRALALPTSSRCAFSGSACALLSGGRHAAPWLLRVRSSEGRTHRSPRTRAVDLACAPCLGGRASAGAGALPPAPPSWTTQARAPCRQTFPARALRAGPRRAATAGRR